MLERLNNIKKTAAGARIFQDVNIEELEDIDAEKFVRDQLEKEKREAQLKVWDFLDGPDICSLKRKKSGLTTSSERSARKRYRS